MAHLFTNISNLKRIPVYERAAKETNAPVWIGNADHRGLPEWKGLWGERLCDLSDFWEAVRRIDAEAAKVAA